MTAIHGFLLGLIVGIGFMLWLGRGQKVVHPEYLDILAKQTYNEYPPPTVPDLIVKDAATRLKLYHIRAALEGKADE